MILNSFSLAKLSCNNSDAAWLKLKAKLTVFICFVLISLIRTKTPENYSVLTYQSSFSGHQLISELT